MAAMPSEELTAEYLFECTQCGECCKGFGGTYVSSEDIERIANFLNLSPDTLRRRYCAPSGRRLVLAQQENGYCVFWDRICTIHPVKPRMCRMWPFIPSLLKDVDNWWIMADSCPGIRQNLDKASLSACLRRIIGDLEGDSRC